MLGPPSAQSSPVVNWARPYPKDGYLVIGSSRETVAEGVRLHRSGESLGKSKKLLVLLPPGSSPVVSALLYQDPIAMMQLNLQRFAPDMAGTLAKFGGGGTPPVIRLYGEDNAIRRPVEAARLTQVWSWWSRQLRSRICCDRKSQPMKGPR
jgi:hypothetical protein